MGRNFIVDDKNSTRWCSGQFVQIEDTWVWSTQNRIGIVRHGNSEDFDAQLSKVEEGEKKKISETSTAKFWRQEWENWKKVQWLRVAGD